MKLIYAPLLFMATALLLSCEDNDVKPVSERVVLPLRLEQDDHKREFNFDTKNRVIEVKNFNYYPAGVVLETSTEFFYSPDGKLDKTLSDTGYRKTNFFYTIR